MTDSKSPKSGISRRGFLKAAGATAGAAALVGASGALTALAEDNPKNNTDGIYSVACTVNCNSGHCTMDAHVREGKLYKLTAKKGLEVPDDLPVYEFDRRPCLRGRSHVQAIYHPERIKYPMRRVGERGSDQWERISWDDAINEIATKLMAYQSEFGPQSVAMTKMWGSNGTIQGNTGVQQRFISAICGTYLNDCLDEGIYQGIERVYGFRYATSNSWWDIANANRIIFWGVNVSEVWAQNWCWVTMAHDAGAKSICIDPRYSITAQKSSKWVPINIGTDTTLAMGIINYLLVNELYDKDFVREHSVAPYLVRRDNQMFLRADAVGLEYPEPEEGKNAPAVVWDAATGTLVVDGAAADPAMTGVSEAGGFAVDTALDLLRAHVASFTPEKVQESTGVDPETLEEIVMAFVEGPTTMWLGMGLDRYDNSHFVGHALATIVSLTGNVGRPGAGYGYPNVAMNRIFTGYPSWSSPDPALQAEQVPWLCLPEILNTGTFKGEPFDIKALMVVSGNPFSNHSQQKELIEEVLPKLELIVTHDYRMTDTCRYSDYVLPSAHAFEDYELCPSAFLHLNERVIDPLYESKSNTEFLSVLATKMGLGEYFSRTSYEVTRDAINESEALQAVGVDFNVLENEGSVFNLKPEGYDALWVKEYKFGSPSGKLEFYCEKAKPRMDYGQEIDQSVCHLPMESRPIEAWAGSELSERFPIILYQEHSRWRVHSMFGHLPWLRELDPEPTVKLSPADAAERGIEPGDVVEIYNDRGTVTVKAAIDASLPRGMANLPKGWQRDQFIDGCYQELTSRFVNPITVNQSYADVRVQIEKRG